MYLKNLCQKTAGFIIQNLLINDFYLIEVIIYYSVNWKEGKRRAKNKEVQKEVSLPKEGDSFSFFCIRSYC